MPVVLPSAMLAGLTFLRLPHCYSLVWLTPVFQGLGRGGGGGVEVVFPLSPPWRSTSPMAVAFCPSCAAKAAAA